MKLGNDRANHEPARREFFPQEAYCLAIYSSPLVCRKEGNFNDRHK